MLGVHQPAQRAPPAPPLRVQVQRVERQQGPGQALLARGHGRAQPPPGLPRLVLQGVDLPRRAEDVDGRFGQSALGHRRVLPLCFSGLQSPRNARTPPYGAVARRERLS